MKGSTLKLSDVLITAVFLLSILSVLTYDVIIILISMVFCFWIISVYTVENDTPYILAKLEKCPNCNSKSAKFFGWTLSLHELYGFIVSPESRWDIFTGNFKIKCEKCKKVYGADLKIRTIYSLLHISVVIFPIIIYFFFLIPFIGIPKIDVTRVPVLFIPLLIVFIIHAYFRMKFKT